MYDAFNHIKHIAMGGDAAKYEKFNLGKKDCLTAAREEFSKAGGYTVNDPNLKRDFELAYKRAATSKAADAIEACAEAKGGKYDASCAEEGEKYYVLNGGDPDDFRRAMSDGAARKLLETFEGCIDEELDMDESDSTEKEKEKRARDMCVNDALEEFKQAGGDEAEFKEKAREGARNTYMESMKACVETAGGDKGKNASCKENAAKAYKKLGGKEGTLRAEVEKAVIETIGEDFDACMTATMDASALKACALADVLSSDCTSAFAECSAAADTMIDQLDLGGGKTSVRDTKSKKKARKAGARKSG